MKILLFIVLSFPFLFSIKVYAGSIQGYAYSEADGLPAEGAIVSVIDRECIADSLGYYQIDNLEPGMYEIYLDLPNVGYAPAANILVTDYAATRFDFVSYSELTQSNIGELLNGRMVGINISGEVFSFSPIASEAKIQVVGNIQELSIFQSFRNTSSEPLEVAFLFPLTYYCFVNNFSACLGDKSVVGRYISSNNAEIEYFTALEEGRISPLLLVDYPYSLNRILGKLGAGEVLEVEFSFIGPVTQINNQFEITFPMAGGSEGNIHSRTFRETSPTIMIPGTNVSLEVDIKAGAEVVDVESVFPEGVIEESIWTVPSIPGTQWIPATDYLLHYSLDNSEHPASALVSDTHFMLTLEPDILEPCELSTPKEYIFVVDCSSYSTSRQLSRAVSFVEIFLELLQPEDTFQIVRLGEEECFFSTLSLPAVQMNLTYALAYLYSLSNHSMILNAGFASVFTDLVFTNNARVVILLSSGHLFDSPEFIEVIEEIQDAFLSIWFVNLGNVYSRNFDNSLIAESNRVFMLERHHSPNHVAERLWDRINGFCIENVEIDWGGHSIIDVAPSNIPVLYESNPVFVYGRYEGEFPESLFVSGTHSDSILKYSLAIDIKRTNGEICLADAWAFSFCKDRESSDRANLDDSSVSAVASEFSLQTSSNRMLLFDEINDECISIFPRSIRFDEIFGGQTCGPYITSESRPVMTSQMAGRFSWSYCFPFRYFNLPIRQTVYGQSTVSDSNREFCSIPSVIVTSPNGNGSVSLLSISHRSEEFVEISNLAEAILSSASETYFSQSDYYDMLLFLNGSSRNHLWIRNGRIVQGEEFDSIFTQEVISNINELFYEIESSVRDLKLVLLFKHD